MRIVNDDIHEGSASQLLMQASCSEVHVARYMVARFNKKLGHQVFGATALMRRHHIFLNVEFFNNVFEVIEVLAPCIGLITQH